MTHVKHRHSCKHILLQELLHTIQKITARTVGKCFQQPQLNFERKRAMTTFDFENGRKKSAELKMMTFADCSTYYLLHGKEGAKPNFSAKIIYTLFIPFRVSIP
jgi:hypothetical protein